MPLEKNSSYEHRQEAPTYSALKEQNAKGINIAHFMPFAVTAKENQFKPLNETLDSQAIYDELCGKKRSRTSFMNIPHSGIVQDAQMQHSIIYSPSKLRYESCGSSGSQRSTPHLYEHEEESKHTPYYRHQNSPCNAYDEYRRQEAEEEDMEEETENNPGNRTARSERGLKRLSVKVRDLVFKLKETSYKDVANRLIDELVTDEDYDESGRKLDKKTSNERKTKEEKNVRRRVYDALNVLIASGVLKKNVNKNVMYEEKPESRMKGLKLVIKKK